MSFIKHTYLFIQHNLQQIKRRSFILPLILLFPVFLIGLVILLLMPLFDSSEQAPIQLGVVNQDQSKETEMVIEILEETSEFGPFMQIEAMDENQAIHRMESNDISAYLLLPEDFTSHLYDGYPVTMSVTGNPEQEMESNVVHELINSVMRHIETSQANILLVNEYAKKVDMDDEIRSGLVMDEFMRTLLSVAGKDKIISEDTVQNYSTTSPSHYFMLSAFFIILTIWLLVMYHFLFREEAKRMTERMRLYGVTFLQQMTARMLVTLLVTAVFTTLAFIIMTNVISFDLDKEDYVRIAIICFSYSSFYLLLLAICEIVFSSPSIRLLVHSVLTIVLIGLSGALIPTIYFPLYLQDILTFIPATEALFWLQEIVLNDRLYADYSNLFTYVGTALLFLVILSLWKERVQR